MKSERLDFGQTGEVVLKTGFLKKILESHIDVKATESEAWNMLVDFDSWHKWNKFIPMVSGQLRVKEKLEIVVVSPGMKQMVFKPIVFVVEPKKRIIWGGGSLWAGYRGMHHFVIEQIDDRTIRFTQREVFEGLMVLFIGQMILKTAEGYAMMNYMFKKTLESRIKKMKENYIWKV